MKRSKHFRKDVIIARVIFAAICIGLLLLVGSLVSALMNSLGNHKDTQNTESQMSENTDIQQEEDIGSQIIEGDTEAESESQSETYVVTTTTVRLRDAASTSGAIITNLPEGAKLLVLEAVEGWYRVSYDIHVGYVSADYVVPAEEQMPEDTQTVVNRDYVIMLDPGHQLQGDTATEPNGPDSAEMKARVTSGAVGVSSGVAEYELTLEIAQLLKTELETRGYTVLMTRETHEVNISNMERAIAANDAGADITVRIHANSYTDSSVYGAETIAPSTGNQYVSDLAEESQKLAQSIINAYCEATGMHNRGVKIDDTMTGINWCEMPVTIIELGFMSNPTDDTNMQDDAYQQKMIKGIADGIDAYFGN